MVALNFTEAVFNTKEGEVVLHSKHPLKLQNKTPKIVGVVSILLVQDHDIHNVDSSVGTTHNSKHGVSVIDLDANNAPAQPLTQTIPASLSFIPIPSILSDNVRAGLLPGLTQSFCNGLQLKGHDSETATVPKNVSQQRPAPNVHKEMYNCSLEEHTSRGKWNNPQEQEKSNLFVDSSQQINGENKPDMYITVEPREDGLSEVNTVSCINSDMFTDINPSTLSYTSQGIIKPESQNQDNDIENQAEMYITVKPREDNSMPNSDVEEDWKESTVPQQPLTALVLSQGSKFTTFPGKSNQKNYNVPKLLFSSQRTVYRNILPKIERRKSIVNSTNHNNNSKNSPRCSECQFKLVTYKELIAHNYTAHGKLNTCPICNKFFMSRGSFIRHGVAHMQRRSFKCSVCFAYFSRKDNLKRHFKVNHKNLDWKPDDSNCVSETGEEKPHPDDSTDILTSSDDINSSSVFPSFESAKSISPVPTTVKSKSISPAPTTVKSSKLNSIVDNLHSRKGKLPLLRSILTTPKTSLRNKQSHDGQDPNQRELTKSKNKAFTSFVCSLCKAAFLTLPHLKSHIVRIHGESVSDELLRAQETSDDNLFETSVLIEDQPTNGMESSSNESTDIVSVADSLDIENSLPEVKREVPTAVITHDHANDIRTVADTHSNILQIPSLNKHGTDEMDIESWVKSQYNYDDTNKETETSSTISDQQPCFPHSSQPLFPGTQLQFPSSGSQQFPTASSPNHFCSSESPTTNPQHSNTTKITIRKDKKNFKVVDPADLKPKKRRIAAHNEMTVCRLCGVYLVTGAEIVQHGQQSHPDQLETATCVVCFTKLSGYDALYRHCQLHFGKTFSCQFCKSKFTRKDNLTRHVKNTHSKQANLNTTV